MVTSNFTEKVASTLLDMRGNYGGSESAFARSLGISPSIYTRLKKGEREGLLSDAKWIELGRKLGVSNRQSDWIAVDTDVFRKIKEEILLCKEHGLSRIFVDNCGIGKTFTAKYLARNEKNIFYIDCTQCRRKNAFVKALARAVGVEIKGKIDDIKDNTKYTLSVLENPIVIIDEAGALDKDALGLAQEYWNATDENMCGWYLMGANALRNKIERGVANDRDYFAELFSRYSEKFSRIVPVDESEKKNFYKKLIRDVIAANIKDKSQLNTMVNRCLVVDEKTGTISGLRRAKSLLMLNNA